MKKLILGILVLFLVALVPSVMAADWKDAPDGVPEDQTWLPSDTKLVDLTGYLDNIVDGDELGLTAEHFTGSGICEGTTPLVCELTLTTEPVDWHGKETVTFWVDDETNPALGTTDLTVNTAPVATDTNVETDEDTPIEITLEATDADSDSLTYLVEDPSYGTINLNGNKVAYTPDSNYEGSDHFTFKVNDGLADSNVATVSVTVTAVNDAPVLPDLDDYTLQEKLLMNTLVLSKANDVDNLVLMYTLEVVDPPEDSTFDRDTHWNENTMTISGWEPVRDDVGELKLRLTVDDGELTNEQTFSLHVYPKYMCEEGEIGTDDLTLTVDEPENGDDYGPGDTIYLEVTVENDASHDKDVVVVAMLYDLTDHKKLAEVESDEENLDESGEDDDELTFKLELQVPLDSDVDYKGEYVLYVKAYEDNEEDEQCLSDMVELDITRESHEVIVKDMSVTPSTANPGETVDVSVTVLNLGRKDEEGVVVKLRSEDLEISLTSDAKDLGAYDESGCGYVFEFEVEVPLDLEAGTYDLEAYVVFDGGAESTSYIDSPTFNVDSSMVVVEESSIVTTTGLTTAEETLEEETTTEEEFPWSTVAWIVGDIVLIIVAIFFIKLIFSGRKRQPEIKEVKL